ncbi:MAG: formylglycine-generating enzyme family protein, partial [Planctomycetes bacterium]|nr:formylglycine-generating enzyme family protein [Planctomycetota bacterium]
DTPMSSTPPARPEYAVTRATPLPPTLTIKRDVGGRGVEIELCLVPQGWFIMGDNDGIVANGPRRWVWLDDYYISKYECTNAQYYGFILANGYRDSEWWTQEGIEYMRDSVRDRGTELLGWTPLDGRRRLWALASPDNDVVLEVQDPDTGFGQPDITVLVLPEAGNYADYLSYDQTARQVYLKYGDDWKAIDGRDIRATANTDSQFGLKKNGYLHFTSKQGQSDLTGVPRADRYKVIAWANGDDAAPLFGDIRRGGANYLRGENMPVVGVSWFEGDACTRFFGGALPTEAQWEKAARGIDGRPFPWGNELEMTEQANTDMGKRQVTARANLNRWRLEPVGSYPKGVSVYGVHDMVGNAAEWCRDVFQATPEWIERNPFNTGGAKERRSLRGTHTDEDDPQTAKLHHRRYSDPYDRRVPYNRGFRIVMQPEAALSMAGQ